MQVKINNKILSFDGNKTILQIAKDNNIEIPTLCFLKGICEDSNCRICVVENAKTHRLVPSCSTYAVDGDEYLTNSAVIIESRKKTLTLLLEKHHKDCFNCNKNGSCKLQDLFNNYGFGNVKKQASVKYKIDNSSPCIFRNQNKCILCGRCINVCSKIQNVSALTKIERGYNTKVGCAYDGKLTESTCVGCGQCSLVCPTGAIGEKSELNTLKKLLSNKNNYVIAQVAPSVRVSLAESFGEKVGTFDEGRLVTALKLLGFQKVFDINMGADFTVIEEAEELYDRLKNNVLLPQFSSCCPAWFKYCTNFYPNYANHISTCKSPTEMLGAIVKNYYSKISNINKKNIKVVGIMPCTAKKGEKQRAKDVDCVITTRELAKLIKDNSIDYLTLNQSKFDTPLSYYSGAGLIFGASGGVTEAVLRYLAYKLAPNEKKIDFCEVRNSEGVKEIEVKITNTILKLCIVSGLANAKKVVDEVVAGKKHYHFIEVMACPGGCVNGGGQSHVDYSKYSYSDVRNARAESLYKQDKLMKTRTSAQNNDVEKIYKDFLISKEIKHKLLHNKF